MSDEFGRVLRRLRGERSIRELAEAAAVSKSTISALEAGTRRPSATIARALDRALGTGGQLVAHLGAQSLAGQSEELRLGIATNLAAASTMSDAAVEDWEYTVSRHAEATRWRPETTQLPDLISDLAELQRQLGHRHHTVVRRRLTTCMAQLSGLMALTLLKTGEPTAREWWRTSRNAAAAAEDPAALSWVYAQEAYHSFYADDLLSALQLAGRAQYIAGGRPCVGAALAAPLEARAHAILGRADRAAAAIAAAHTALDRLDPVHHTASALGYTQANLHFHVGDTWTHLGDSRRAEGEFAQALALYPDRDHTDRALITLDQAACLITDGHADAAAELAARTLATLPDQHRSALIIYRARQVAETVPEGAPRQMLRDALAGPDQ